MNKVVKGLFVPLDEVNERLDSMTGVALYH